MFKRRPFQDNQMLSNALHQSHYFHVELMEGFLYHSSAVQSPNNETRRGSSRAMKYITVIKL